MAWTYATHLSLVAVDNTIKLLGAGAFAFHPTLEWIFVGDRRGTLLAWDVSTERPNMIGMLEISLPISLIFYLLLHMWLCYTGFAGLCFSIFIFYTD